MAVEQRREQLIQRADRMANRYIAAFASGVTSLFDRQNRFGDLIGKVGLRSRNGGGSMDRVGRGDQAGPFLFLAEGLLMYLPPDGVRALVLELQSRFPGSELVFETVNSVWLKLSLKSVINLKLQKELGLGRGTEYQFGIRDGHELEEWSPGLRFLEEWTYVDEDEPRIGLMRRFRNWKLLRYAQCTVRYLLGPKGAPR